MGRSEEIIGKAIKKYSIPRHKLVILSKCFFGVIPADEDGNLEPIGPTVMTNDGAMVNEVGLSRKHILDAVDASVARLGTYIDVLQIHRLGEHEPCPLRDPHNHVQLCVGWNWKVQLAN